MTIEQYWNRRKRELVHRLRAIIKQLKGKLTESRRRYLEARKDYHLQRFLDLKALIKRNEPKKEVKDAQGNLPKETDRAEVLRESQ